MKARIVVESLEQTSARWTKALQGKLKGRAGEELISVGVAAGRCPASGKVPGYFSDTCEICRVQIDVQSVAGYANRSGSIASNAVQDLVRGYGIETNGIACLVTFRNYPQIEGSRAVDNSGK